MAKDYGQTAMAKKYREKYGWEMPTLKLARIMHKETAPMFQSVEYARERLRYIEGKSCKKDMPTHKNIPNRPLTKVLLPRAADVAVIPETSFKKSWAAEYVYEAESTRIAFTVPPKLVLEVP
jgi:hypothetical protein